MSRSRVCVVLTTLLLSAAAVAQDEARICAAHQRCVEVPAGTYHTSGFEVPMTYTLPAGWEIRRDTRYQLALGRAVDEPRITDYLPTMIWVYKDLMVHSRNCKEGPEPRIGYDPNDLVAYWRSVPGIMASEPEPVTVGGLTGLTMDVTVQPDWAFECPWSDGYPTVLMYFLPPPDGYAEAIYPDEHTRLFVLSYQGGNITFVVSHTPESPLTWDEWLSLTRSIIDSFEFGGL